VPQIFAAPCSRTNIWATAEEVSTGGLLKAFWLEDARHFSRREVRGRFVRNARLAEHNHLETVDATMRFCASIQGRDTYYFSVNTSGLWLADAPLRM
jgi:hypothetical protein